MNQYIKLYEKNRKNKVLKRCYIEKIILKFIEKKTKCYLKKFASKI